MTAESGLGEDADPEIARSLHTLAGMAWSNLGDLVKAREHYQDAYDLSVKLNDIAHQAQALSSLAGVTRHEGRLQDALELANQAVNLHNPPSKATLMQTYETCMALGFYEDALRIVTAQDNTHTCADCLCLARIYVETNKPYEAWAHLQKASKAFVNDRKTGLSIHSLESVLMAMLGQNDVASSIMYDVTEEIASARFGRSTKLDAYGNLVRASFLLQNNTDCLRFLEHFRALTPYSPDFSKTLFFAAESCASVGDYVQAITLYQQSTTICPTSAFGLLALEKISA